MCCILLLTVAATAAASVNAMRAGMPGGYRTTNVTDELSALLYKSLANETLYAAGVTSRVCVTKIESIDQQVVAGMNYRFTMNGCDVPKTLNATNASPSAKDITQHLGHCEANFTTGCVATNAVVTVYQSFDDSVQVSHVEVETATGARAGVHAAVI